MMKRGQIQWDMLAAVSLILTVLYALMYLIVKEVL